MRLSGLRQPQHLFFEFETELLGFVRREPFRHVRENGLPHVGVALRPGHSFGRTGLREQGMQAKPDRFRIGEQALPWRLQAVFARPEQARLRPSSPEKVSRICRPYPAVLVRN
jgi:hypothetical protein